MKKNLTKVTNVYHYKNGTRVDGAPSEVSGDLTEVSGDLTGISGNLTECEITPEDRERGIDISDLVRE